MAINQNIEQLAARVLDLLKPEVKDNPEQLKVITLGVHIGANLFTDIKRTAVALERIADALENLDQRLERKGIL